ncbi:zwei Ig domain protein zig-8-like isoform X1, partial [Vespula squamosa]
MELRKEQHKLYYTQEQRGFATFIEYITVALMETNWRLNSRKTLRTQWIDPKLTDEASILIDISFPVPMTTCLANKIIELEPQWQYILISCVFLESVQQIPKELGETRFIGLFIREQTPRRAPSAINFSSANRIQDETHASEATNFEMVWVDCERVKGVAKHRLYYFFVDLFLFPFFFKRLNAAALKKDINVIPPSGLFLSDRRIPYNIPSDWRALWLSNLDELQRINDANDNNTVSNVTVQLGGTAFLHCKVRNLADRTVSDAEKRGKGRHNPLSRSPESLESSRSSRPGRSAFLATNRVALLGASAPAPAPTAAAEYQQHPAVNDANRPTDLGYPSGPLSVRAEPLEANSSVPSKGERVAPFSQTSSISWIRRRDFHVLTSSTFTYTNDERFQVLHAEGSDDWTLQIKYVQERDNGTYECQFHINDL